MNLGFEKIETFYNDQGQVIIENLESGFGTTLGVALRRVLYRHIPGSSVVGIRIPDVPHQYQLIPGAATDVVSLIVALNDLHFKVSGEGTKTIRFKEEKAGEYSGHSLVLPEGVELLNPEIKLLDLLGDQPVEMEIFVRNGRGYLRAEENDEFKSMPGVIPVDGHFSPVVKVGYHTEEMRIGGDDSYEKLIMDIKTDGSIQSMEAAMLAARICKENFSFFEGMSDIAERVELYKEKKEEKDRILDLKIESLGLSVRSFNCLEREKYDSVRKIILLSEQELAAIPQMGRTSVNEVKAKVEELGFELRKD